MKPCLFTAATGALPSAVTILLLANAAYSGPAFATDTQEEKAGMLAPVIVRADNNGDLLSPSWQRAQLRLWTSPENASVVRAADYEGGAVLSLRDALSRTPGIFVQGNAGRQATQISIRGSGLNSPLGSRGVAILRDGMPVGQADGSVNPMYADPFNARYIEILRGAAGLRYGASTLGGAINIVSPTGYSNPGLETRIQAGSRGYLQAQSRAGQVFENGMDAFASVSHFHTEGPTDHANQKSTRFYGNLGIQYSPAAEGRFHLDIDRLDQDIVDPVTLAQLQNRSGASGPNPDYPYSRTSTHPHIRLAYQHTLQYNGTDSLTLGTHYTSSRFDLLGTAVPIYYDAVDYGVSVRGELQRSWLERSNTLIWGVNFSRGRSSSETYGPFTLPRGRIYDRSTDQFEDIHANSQTTEVYGENSFQLTPRLAVVSGANAVTATRARTINALRNPPGLPYFRNVDASDRYTGISPKAGLLWQATPHAQLYASVSRSFEPPTGIELYNSTGTTAAQRATSVEVGTRGATQPLRWEVALFHSRIKDQLLRIPKPAGTPGEGFEGGNIDHSSSTGLELSLGGSLKFDDMPGSIEWNLAYTWNRFRFIDDPVFGNNAVPGIPEQYGRIGITYRHPSGVYFGPSLDFASSWYVDQENMLEASGYGLTNFTVGYADPAARYLLFIEGRNLGDKRYAAATQYIAMARSGPNEPAYYPGAGRAVYAGAEIRW